jgi:hypothetical protein
MNQVNTSDYAGVGGSNSKPAAPLEDNADKDKLLIKVD